MKLYESIDSIDKIYLVVEHLDGMSLAIYLQQTQEQRLGYG